MRYIYIIGLMLMVLLIACGGVRTEDRYARTISIFNQSNHVSPFFEEAYGYAVFPRVGKGGLIFGGSYGKGQVYRQGVATGASSLLKFSLGLQAGGQALSEIIFFQDQRAYDEFTDGSFEFGATASAVAITAAAQAQTSTAGPTAGVSAGPATALQARTKYTKGMAVFIHAKGGLMYEASIGGQKYSFRPY